MSSQVQAYSKVVRGETTLEMAGDLRTMSRNTVSVQVLIGGTGITPSLELMFVGEASLYSVPEISPTELRRLAAYLNEVAEISEKS